MRLLLAMFKHETNTFSPVPTRFDRFFKGRQEALCGDDALGAFRNTGSALGGYIDVAERLGAEVVLPVAAEAWPSGPVDDQAYQRISKLILDQVEIGGFDGILLDLHGAMVTQSLEDGEGALLAHLREIDPKTPVGVTLDMHANMYDDIVKHATVVTGYHTYPHIDMFQAGQRAANILMSVIAGKIKPTMAWGNRPMLPHVLRQGTHSDPNKSLQSKCIAFEQNQALAVSLFVGFPNADITNAGLSVVVCTDNDPAAARRLCDELLDQAWSVRQEFVYDSEPLQQSVSRAKQITQGPVVLLDHCDNCASGGTMDTTVVLAEVLRQGLENAVFYAIFDPTAAEIAARAGVGANITLKLGGRVEMPALIEESHPLEVNGKVKFVFDGLFRNHGPMSEGVLNDTGTTVVLDTGKVEIVIISKHQEPFDSNCLHSAGIDPSKKRYVVLKSRVHWRAGFGNLAREVVDCNGLGVTTSDYSKLKFKNVRRPIYPLDSM